MRSFEKIMKNSKLIIGMVHLPPLPGTAHYDRNKGMNHILDVAYQDMTALQENGIDSFMFGNEGDRPYLLKASSETLSAMSFVIGQLKKEIKIPFGVNYLWDPVATVSLACAADADFAREVFTGVYDSDMGLWEPKAAEALKLRSDLGNQKLKLLFNINAGVFMCFYAVYSTFMTWTYACQLIQTDFRSAREGYSQLSSPRND